jgi:hypothetical protein
LPIIHLSTFFAISFKVTTLRVTSRQNGRCLSTSYL